MRFEFPDHPSQMISYIPVFLDLVGEDRWKKRAVQLSLDSRTSPWDAKVVLDFHWLEMKLSRIILGAESAALTEETLDAYALSALRFAGMIVEVHGRLSLAGQRALQGRLRDGMKAGFSSLYRELDTALLLLEEGYDVDFPDLEGTDRFDLFFRRGPVESEIECKSQSVDAGRKIHRRDFYRFVKLLSPTLCSRQAESESELLLITVADRFPRGITPQEQLVADSRRILSQGGGQIATTWYTIDVHPLASLGLGAGSTVNELYFACRAAFGVQCHVAGPVTDSGASLVVVRSQQEDDTSKVLLESFKKAQSQLTGRRPGYIAVQFDDIEPSDLILPHLRRRVALLANYLFHSRDCHRLAAIYCCPFRSLHLSERGLGSPAIVCWNPRLNVPVDDLPFRRAIGTADFAQVLGVDPPELNDPLT